jgi:hypothetical protein
MVSNALLVWAITVDRIFRADGERSNFLLFTVGLGAIGRVVSMLLKANL